MPELNIEIDDEDLTPDDEELASIGALADHQLNLETEIDAGEEKLKALKAELKKVQQSMLPEAMQAANCRRFDLANGAVVTIKEDLSISVPKKHMDEIATWLRDEGYKDLIKNAITIEFDRGHDNMVLDVKGYAEDLGLSTSTATSINSGTLKALLREQMEGGNLKKELAFFGAYAWKKSVIKQ